MAPAKANSPLCHIVTVGDELLAGDTVDTNSAFLAQRCRALGIVVTHARSVRDRIEEIEAGVRDATASAQLCLVSGGLGPTTDDVTAAAVARAAGVELSRDEVALAEIEAKFRAFGRRMAESNRKQADLPVGSIKLDNPVGTAPGFMVDVRGCSTFCMPGVPHELRKMMIEQVEPRVRDQLALEPVARRIYRTLGMGESSLAARVQAALESARSQSPGLNAMFVHYRANAPEVMLIVEATPDASGARATTEELASLDGGIASALEPALYGIGEADLPTRLVAALTRLGLRFCTAESCTAGGAAAIVASVAGASACLDGGIVAYDNAIKRNLLGVPGELLEQHGAVSEPVARAMAEGARASLGSDLSVGITGIAGPTGGSAEKPIGTVHFAVSDTGGTTHKALRLIGNRGRVQRSAGLWALKLVWDRLVQQERASIEEVD